MFHRTVLNWESRAIATPPAVSALIVIVPMLIGVALAPYHRGAGAAVFFTGLILTLLLGGWLTGGWILQDLTLAQWHPGYVLPTVAGGLIAAAGSASLGFNSLANADARLRHAVTCALLAVITLAIGLLGLMTIRGLVERSYLPRAPNVPQARLAPLPR